MFVVECEVVTYSAGVRVFVVECEVVTHCLESVCL